MSNVHCKMQIDRRASAAESRNDFLHKLGVVLKELRESHYWLSLVMKSKLLPEARVAALDDECDQLCRVIAKSIVTTKANRKRRSSSA